MSSIFSGDSASAGLSVLMILVKATLILLAAFVILLVALLSGSRGTDRVVHKRTIVRE